MAEVPEDLRYDRTHEWVRVIGEGRAKIGITDFAQQELHEIVYVELPEIGAYVRRSQEFAAVESVKARSEIFSPVTGRVIRVNESLIEGDRPARPELINNSPYDEGWLVEVEMTDEGEIKELLDAQGYRIVIEAKE